jgi:hypothetical protein
MLRDPKAPLMARLATSWPVFAVGLGLAASIAWTAALGWLVLHAARLIL